MRNAEALIAARYMLSGRREGFISVISVFSFLGIMLGVATLIIVLSVMNGFRSELLQRILGLNGHIIVRALEGEITDFDALAARIAGIEGVTMVTPLAEAQVLATRKGNATGVLARGIRPDDLGRREIIADHIVDGALGAFGEGNGVVIGARLARRLGAGVGDEITLISPKGTVTAFGTVPRMMAFPVVALFEIGMFEYDNSYVFMPLEVAQRYLGLDDGVPELEVFTSNPETVKETDQRLLRALPPGLGIIDWRQRNASFFNALRVERNVMFLILTLIILVAAFNIISGLIMLVKDKSADIAILRTVGAPRAMIMRIFFIAGAGLGASGTLAGAALGLVFVSRIEAIRQFLEGLTGTALFSPEIYFLSKLPAETDPREVVTVVLMALGLSVLATLYPSWRAAKLDPIEGLRQS